MKGERAATSRHSQEIKMSKPYEKINHPDHYQSGKVEAIDAIEAFNLNFSLGSAVKYILRAGKKPSETATEDLSKAIWYLQREIERRNS